MNDTAAVLKKAHAELWAFREEMEDVWPTPPTKDALPFAVTEAAEALDAWMRISRPQYARNRDRLDGEDAVLDELADCAMMLLTARGKENSTFCPNLLPLSEKDELGTNSAIEEIVVDVALLLVYSRNARIKSYRDSDNQLEMIATYPGMDLLPRLQSRYARIRAKQQRTERVESDLDDEHNVEPGYAYQGWGTDIL